MEVKRGLYKRVFIFKNFVVKTPIDFNGVKAILSEQYGYITVDKDKKTYAFKNILHTINTSIYSKKNRYLFR